MGKKSKQKAAAKSAGSAALASTALVPTGTKKQRCDGCCSLLKDIANIKPCPGCSSLFCWRCEKKSFLGCPNADLCSSPSRRCPKCSSGRTMLSKLATVRIMPPDCFTDEDGTPLLKNLLTPDLLESFKMLVRQHQDLTVNAVPLLLCGANDCSNNLGCGNCVDCTGIFRFCSRCDKHRCSDCAEPFQNQSPFDKSKLILLMMSASLEGPSEAWESFQRKNDTSFGWTDGMASCSSCNSSICFECLDKMEAKRMMKSFLNQSFGSPSYFLCAPCYWMTKPCTNAACPHVLGSVPTKRCSGCHIDRYCGVDCQAAAYPQHMDRCKTIREKLTASGKYVADERGCHKVQPKSPDDDDSSGGGGGGTSDGSDDS